MQPNADDVLAQLLNVAGAMLACGAEINRVEDTLTRLGMAYGAAQMHVFVITSSVVITMVLPDGSHYTQTRRIHAPGGTDFTQLEALNALSRRCCAAPMPITALAAEVARIQMRRPGRCYRYFGSVLAAGAFTLFFGGTVLDMAAAILFALLICLLQGHLMPLCSNQMVFNLLCSLIVGAGIVLAARLLPALQPDQVMIGDIMLLIPGIAMTNAVRDILVGETISGIMRLIESLLWAGALAAGFMVAIWLIGG